MIIYDNLIDVIRTKNLLNIAFQAGFEYGVNYERKNKNIKIRNTIK